MRRGLALAALLCAAYAATLGIPALGAADYAGDEPHHLLVAASIASDGDVDLRDEYAEGEASAWSSGPVEPRGELTRGRRHEPVGVGLGALAAPAYALGGPVLVELWLGLIAAAGFALAWALARRLVPEPYALAGVVFVALSPPALAYGQAVLPEAAAGTALAGATLLALRCREDPRWRDALAAAALLALLPWLGTKYLLPGLPVAVALCVWCARRRRLMAFWAAEVMAGSLIVFASVNEALFGGPTPYAADGVAGSATGIATPGDLVERIPRVLALTLDRDIGLLRFAPVLALVGVAVWLVRRARRDHLARAAPTHADIEATALLLLAVVGAQIFLAVVLAPSTEGPWFGNRHLVAALPVAAALCAWGLRYVPRAGATLGALTLAGSVWLLLELRLDRSASWAQPGSDAPFGPAVRLLPDVEGGGAHPVVIAVLLAAASAALVVREVRLARRTP